MTLKLKLEILLKVSCHSVAPDCQWRVLQVLQGNLLPGPAARLRKKQANTGSHHPEGPNRFILYARLCGLWAKTWIHAQS